MMVDSIHNILGTVGQGLGPSRAGQADQERNPARGKALREAAAAPPKKAEQSVPAREAGDISSVVKELNMMVKQFAATKVSFDVDEATGRSIVRVVNKETGEVVRQLPPEVLLTLVARMEQLSGLIFNQEV